jgi:hypothetical protein
MLYQCLRYSRDFEERSGGKVADLGVCGNYVEVCSIAKIKRLIGQVEEQCHIRGEPY